MFLVSHNPMPTTALIQPDPASAGASGRQVILGRCYQLGHGVASDGITAQKWCPLFACCIPCAGRLCDASPHEFRFMKAALQGNAHAQALLADCVSELDDGALHETCGLSAVSLYRKAAVQGFARAQHSLGYVLPKGIWASWQARRFVLRVDGFDRECYYSGDGVERDTDQAFSWYGASMSFSLFRKSFNKDGHSPDRLRGC